MDVNEPRGTKRKANDESADDPAHAARRIRALDPDVVNKIAAGEIIVAPVHALKELIENAIDAGSTSLEVLVKEGGLKLLQITDNGHGIDKEDLPILCERFTTSKLSTFEDLSNINTYGFRGEALASISHIAHLQVTTKTKDSAAAWRANYEGGKLTPAKPGQSADPKPTAGRQGTQITVEDLFYNVPTRRKAFRSPSDEFNKIIDMVGRYAIHSQGVAFSCKKHGDAGTAITISSQASTVDRIRQIHGGSVANELIAFEAQDDRWGFKASGWATNANYHIKKTTLLLFINHRSVESTHIKKALEQTYSMFLPKNGHPFVYLNLEIDPRRVDVNVHPTKREVHFLNEDEILQSICDNIREKLAAVDTSRTFLTQTLLPGAISQDRDDLDDAGNSLKTPAPNRRSQSRPNENNLVRTDASLRKITSMFQATSNSPTPGGAGSAAANEPSLDPLYEIIEREPIVCRLTSVRDLRSEVRDDMHHELTEIIASHTFVGIVDEQRRLAAIQGGVKLYLIDYGRACFEYFYQVGLTDFGNFGTIRFQPALSLRDILRTAAEHEKATAADGELMDDDDFDIDEVVAKVEQQLIERREMLQEYFSLEISPSGELWSIPLLMRGYTPSLAKLPQFLLRLGPYVDWTEEKACFETFLRELASFYVPEQLPSLPGTEQAEEDIPDEVKERRAYIRRTIEHVIFPALKARLVATKSFMKSGVLELASLKGLYRVFERC
ncbi:DNA mismatch repair protein [Microdochium trichocladiopsis]|uniref:DNA mismatch repair protein n=1 Tax=Microdochium trichocladiopsis TaxID=1682393 RepID=A0A9P9BQD4_9PEZI|nr:DNA mismatch repair protein [Microdochium trichocladiopsis]KAH7030827.1 DNA mismatch repair protein [Microdochium trichocladiopsis]